MGVNQPFQLYSCPNFLLLLLWLQFLSNNIPGLGVKVLAYKYIKLNYEMFEDCHNWRLNIEYNLMHLNLNYALELELCVAI